jgi:cytochrome P450
METLRVVPSDPDWWLHDAEPAYPWLRDEAPVFEVEPGVKTVARYDDVRAVSRDPATFCSSRGVLVLDPLRSGAGAKSGDAPSVLFMDPPEHAQFRKLVSRAFTPRAVAHMEEIARRRTRQILTEVPGREIDFVEHIAVRLPLQMIAALLGMDEVDELQFRRWSDETIKAADGLHADLRVVNEFFGFMMRHIETHRASPSDTILRQLIDAELDGRSLTDAELLIFCMSLLVAGNETTRNLISGGLWALSNHPAQRDWLASNPNGLHDAVEEMLRWVTPVKAFARTATRDAKVGASSVAEGDYLVMLYAAANRDDRAFGATANDFDVRRPPDPAHVAFGFGEHLCLGAALARLEARIVFEELLAASPRIRVIDPPVRLRSTLMNGIVEMIVRLES